MIHSKAYKASNLRGVEMSNSDDFEMAFSATNLKDTSKEKSNLSF